MLWTTGPWHILYFGIGDLLKHWLNIRAEGQALWHQWISKFTWLPYSMITVFTVSTFKYWILKDKNSIEGGTTPHGTYLSYKRTKLWMKLQKVIKSLDQEIHIKVIEGRQLSKLLCLPSEKGSKREECFHWRLLLFGTEEKIKMIWCFTSLSSLFELYQDNGRVIM